MEIKNCLTCRHKGPLEDGTPNCPYPGMKKRHVHINGAVKTVSIDYYKNPGDTSSFVREEITNCPNYRPRNAD